MFPRLISCLESDGFVHVEAEGEVDFFSGPALETQLQALLDRGCRFVQLGLTRMRHLDSSICPILVRASRRARHLGGGVAVVVAQPTHRRLFALTRLDRKLPVCGTDAEAHRALGIAGLLPAAAGC